MTKRTASWVIREKATDHVLFETFDSKKVAALNTEKYRAVPILQHLVEINTAIKSAMR
jgi:hypothetical protein